MVDSDGLKGAAALTESWQGRLQGVEREEQKQTCLNRYGTLKEESLQASQTTQIFICNISDLNWEHIDPNMIQKQTWSKHSRLCKIIQLFLFWPNV